LSSITSNLAAVIASLNAEKADPAQDPAAALRRLRLPGKAREPYVDVVHFGASDLTVVARTLDDEREKLQAVVARVDEAMAALTRVEEILTEAGELVTANSKGAGRGQRKTNQKKVDVLLAELNEVTSKASKTKPELFGGSAALSAGGVSISLEEISGESLGRSLMNGRVVSLDDIKTRGGLDSAKRRSMAEGARKSLTAAKQTVAELREKMQKFESETIRPRVGDVANALAGLFSDASGLGTSDVAIKTAKELREITLASSTAAIAVGAEGWDRERVLDLLT
jgi:hypothetical protein